MEWVNPSGKGNNVLKTSEIQKGHKKETAHAEREPPFGITIRYTTYEMIRSFVALLSTPKGVPVSPLAQRTNAGFMG